MQAYFRPDELLSRGTHKLAALAARALRAKLLADLEHCKHSSGSSSSNSNGSGSGNGSPDNRAAGECAATAVGMSVS